MLNDNGQQMVRVSHCPKIINEFRDKTIAFVGPAPTLLGKGLGKFIDGHDLVCRASHNLCHEEEKKDYGSRCDVLFHHNGSKTILEYKREFLDIMKVEKPRIFAPVRMAKRQHKCPWEKQKVFHMDIIQYYSQALLTDPFLKDVYIFHFGNGLQHTVTDLCQPRPTNCNTGMYALFAMLSMPIKSIFFCGFDFYQGVLGTGSRQYLPTDPHWDNHILWQKEYNPDWKPEHSEKSQKKELVETTHHDQIPQIKLFYWLTEKYKDKIEIWDDVKEVLSMLDKEEAKTHWPKYEFVWDINMMPDMKYHYDF